MGWNSDTDELELGAAIVQQLAEALAAPTPAVEITLVATLTMPETPGSSYSFEATGSEKLPLE
jgi:hypothetical protein